MPRFLDGPGGPQGFSWLARLRGWEGPGEPKGTRLDTARRVGIRCHYCSVGCGIDAWVKDGALTYLDGDEAHPVNGGRLCPKGTTSAQISRAGDRITEPMVRGPGMDHFEPVSWDHVFETLARRIREVRQESWEPELNRTSRICTFGSATVDNEEVYLWVKLNRMLGIHFMQHQASI